MANRQIVLDTETTGLDPASGHRVIEIGAVELVNRKHTGKHFHHYINPHREVEAGALEVHGISNEFLADKPDFSKIVDEFIAFIDGAELIIHNAAFDIGFLNSELAHVGYSIKDVTSCCEVIDSLAIARELHPGQKNNLDALCRRYEVDNSNRTLHGALLDSQILADVYLLMTGGQTALILDDSGEDADQDISQQASATIDTYNLNLFVVAPSDAEQAAHQALLDKINSVADEGCLWLQQNN